MFTPTLALDAALTAVADTPTAATGMRAMLQREAEFPSPTQAMLTGIALDPVGRQVAEQALDDYWSNDTRQSNFLLGCEPDREIIIGSGFHAAVYAAARVRSAYPKPLVLERDDRPGGTFAMSTHPTFYLNSRNRPGDAGLAGDQQAALNHLPGAPIQAAAVSMREYQTNTDLALVIRWTLAQYAHVVPQARVLSVSPDGTGVEVELEGRVTLQGGRVIDARGLGDPVDDFRTNATTILTFAQFMARMATPWPLRGVHRAAVIGGGDSGKCAVESFLGIAPQPPLAAASLDSPERVDWYALDLPTNCQRWQQEVRGRYQAIGRHLQPGRRLRILPRYARPTALPGAALIDNRTYDLVVVCTGNRETTISGLDPAACVEYVGVGGTALARRYTDVNAFRVGPHAALPFTDGEYADGLADIAGSAVALFRTAPKTAALAATLAAPRRL